LRPNVVTQMTWAPPGNRRQSRPPDSRWTMRCAAVVLRRAVPQTTSYARLPMWRRLVGSGKPRQACIPRYGTMYGMKRTTIYLPEEMKARLEAEAARLQITEAELIRRAVDKELNRQPLRGGIITGPGVGAGLNGADVLRENRHIWLEGFGES
jgi:hypothetical protein